MARALRSSLLSLSSLASSSPIETITATFVLVTLIYFQLLHAIKGSEFFHVPSALPAPRPVHLVRMAHPQIQADADSPYFPLSSSPTPYYAPAAGVAPVGSASLPDRWTPVPPGEFRRILESNALDGGYVFPSERGGNAAGEKAVVVLVKQLTVVRESQTPASTSIQEWEHWIMHDLSVDVGGRRYTYQDLCFDCSSTTLTPHPLHPSQSVLTLYLLPPTPDTPTLTYLNHLTRLPPFLSSDNATFRLAPAPGSSWGFLPSLDGAGLFTSAGDVTQSEREEEDLLSGLRNVRWFAYAARAFVMRFYALAKVSLPLPSACIRLELIAERRLGRHLCRPPRLHPHARHIRSPLHQHAQVGQFVLAT